MKHAVTTRRTPVTPMVTGLLQRCGGVTCPPGTCNHDDESMLHRSADGPAPSTVPSIVYEALRSPGQPLDTATKTYMEPRFDHDFRRVQVTRTSSVGLSVGPTDSPAESEADRVANDITGRSAGDPARGSDSRGYDFSAVRIHSDSKAAASARAVGARAYTVGHQVVFADGHYTPGTLVGVRLLAHELAHVVQQGGASSQPRVQRQPDTAASAPVEIRTSAPPIDVPSEKWSEQIEGHYRRSSDTARAEAVRRCRDEGGTACARILTIEEVYALYDLARSSHGDPDTVRAGLAAALPALARAGEEIVSRAPLRLVPTPAPVPGAVPVAWAGPLIIAAVCIACSLQLWAFGKFQDELRARGFIILESALGICIRGCHMPSPREVFPSPDPPILPTMRAAPDWDGIVRWIPPHAGQRSPSPTIRPVAPAERPRTTNCTEEQRKALQSEVERQCKQLPRACKPDMTKAELKRNAFRNSRCAEARDQMNEVCFDGGDGGHRHAAALAWTAYERCWDLYRQADRGR